MKITKAQAQANRAHVVKTASTLFRERGYDGVGVADLMAAAGFTHGGFYKHFRSKADLMAESAACGIAESAALTAGVDMSEFVRLYISRAHRDTLATGCTMAALCGDAVRQPEEVRTTFAAGIEIQLAALSQQDTSLNGADADRTRARSLDILARPVWSRGRRIAQSCTGQHHKFGTCCRYPLFTHSRGCRLSFFTLQEYFHVSSIRAQSDPGPGDGRNC